MAGISLTPGNESFGTGVYNSVVQCGADLLFSLQLTTLTDTGEANADITGSTARCQFRPSPDNEDFVLEANCEIPDPTTGVINISLTNAQTASIPSWVKVLYYDVELFTLSDSFVERVLEGYFNVSRNVTRPILP